MSLVGIVNSLMSAFLLSYFLYSFDRGRVLISRGCLFFNKCRLLPNNPALFPHRWHLNRHSKKICFFFENNWIIIWIFRKYFVTLQLKGLEFRV